MKITRKRIIKRISYKKEDNMIEKRMDAGGDVIDIHASCFNN